MNTYLKGQRNQLKARKWYESRGYQVETVRYSKWLKNKDYFGLWDLICVSFVDIHFVQVKTNKMPDKKWMEKAEKWICPKTAVKSVVVYKDGLVGNTPALIKIVEPGAF